MAAMSRLRADDGFRGISNLAAYLERSSGSEVKRLVESVEDDDERLRLISKIFNMPTSGATSAPSSMPSPASRRAVLPDKPKKALNAFVGFRCYYLNIPGLKDWPMKKLSQPLGILWDRDPNKSKWSLMAKAWSTMRDQLGKDQVPLEKFFGLACPYLRIPPPETYLQELGWTLGVNEQNSLVVEQGLSFPAQLEGFATVDEAHSVEDIIRHVQSCGYARDFEMRPNSTSATFLGHCNAIRSRTTILKQTARSEQAARNRVAERNVRQEKRKIADAVGFPAKNIAAIERLLDTEGMGYTGDYGEHEFDGQQFADHVPDAELNISIGNDVFQIIRPAGQANDPEHSSADAEFHEMCALAADFMDRPMYPTMGSPSDTNEGIVGAGYDCAALFSPIQDHQANFAAFRGGAVANKATFDTGGRRPTLFSPSQDIRDNFAAFGNGVDDEGTFNEGDDAGTLPPSSGSMQANFVAFRDGADTNTFLPDMYGYN